MMKSSSWHRQYRSPKTEAEMEQSAQAYFAKLWREKGFAVIPVDDLTDWTEEGVVSAIAKRLYGERN